MKAFISMLLRELKSVRKEKTIMFAILIQFFIASFSSVLLVGLMAFYDPDSIGNNTQVTINVGTLGSTDRQFVDIMRQNNLRVYRFSDVDKAEAAFKRSSIDCIAYTPESDSNTVDMKLVLPDMDARATVVLMILKGPLKQYENYLREQNGINMNYSDMGGKPYTTYEFLYTVIIPVLMFFPAFVAGSMLIDTVSEEIEGKTMATLLSSPVSLTQVLGAKAVAAIVLAVIQCVLWSCLLRLNNFEIQNLGIVLFFAVIVAVIVTLISLLISVLFHDRERSQFVYSITVVVAVGLSFFLNPSPFSIISRLATGDSFLSVWQILLYLLPLILLAVAFPLVSRRIQAKIV